jgi:hypothetical protein
MLDRAAAIGHNRGVPFARQFVPCVAIFVAAILVTATAPSARAQMGVERVPYGQEGAAMPGPFGRDALDRPFGTDRSDPVSPFGSDPAYIDDRPMAERDEPTPGELDPEIDPPGANWRERDEVQETFEPGTRDDPVGPGDPFDAPPGTVISPYSPRFEKMDDE